MKLTYQGVTYACVSAEKKENEIVIHTGEYADGEEIIYHIYGDIPFDEVMLEDGTWTEPLPHGDRIEQLEQALDLLLSGVTE